MLSLFSQYVCEDGRNRTSNTRLTSDKNISDRCSTIGLHPQNSICLTTTNGKGSICHFWLISRCWTHCFFFLLHLYYTTNILKIQIQTIKKIRHKSRFLSLLRLISGIYVVFNLNSIFYVRNNLKWFFIILTRNFTSN